MEIPTARVMKEDTFRIGATHVWPYMYYYGAISPLEHLEIDGRITTILGVKATSSSFKNYGDYKDKAVDIKYQLLPEGKYYPAVAIGIMDPQGTRIYPAQYLVASKRVGPVDLTLGFGNGRFGKEPLPASHDHIQVEIFSDPKEWLEESQFFGGVQYAPLENLTLMAEYNPIRYDKQTRDPAQVHDFQKPVPSPLNFGLRWKPLAWLPEVDVSYQRGNQLGVGVSMAFNIGKPLIPIYSRMYKETPEVKSMSREDRLAEALHYEGFDDISIEFEDEDLWVEAENAKFFYTTRAIGVILETASKVFPELSGDVHVILKDNGIPLVEFDSTMSDVKQLYADNMEVDQFLADSLFRTDLTETHIEGYYFKRYFDYGFKPSFETLLNDPSGYFKYRLGASAWLSYRPWTGGKVVTGLAAYALDNISTVNKPLSIPVRSDFALYTEKKFNLDMLMFEQIYKWPNQIYGRVSAGLLEVEYGGLDGEVAVPLFGGRLQVGLSGSLVKKRDPGNPLAFRSEGPLAKDYYTTAFFNARLNFPKKDISVEVKTGQFLAGDRGARFTISKFINGVVVSAWYGMTNTSIFSDTANRGYNDKGISVSIPLRLFTGTDSRTKFYYSLSPWTRDVAQDIDHFTPLFDYMNRNTEIYLDKDRKMVYYY